MEKMVDREIAWRIFAHEFNRSNLHFSEGDERTPNYIITPTGVKCNRLFIIGVVTEVEKIGQDNNLWRARIADPTGVFTMYAGQYQPEAAFFLSGLKVPAYAAVVGKARKYEPDGGSVYISIRPEELNNADEKHRDRWVLDTAELTLERIRIIEEALKSGLSGKDLKDFLLKKGASAVHADGAMRAVEHYKNLDKLIVELKTTIIHALQTIASDRDSRIEEIEEAVAKAEPAPEIKESAAEEEPELKDIVAAILDKLDTGQGASYSLILETAKSAGIESEMAESGIKELMAEGRCYEPKIGVLRKV